MNDYLRLLRNQWDRAAAWACVALGGLALVLGWVGVTGTPYAFEQIPFVISGGLGGIFLLGVGATLWISADLREQWRVLDRLVDDPASRSADGPDDRSAQADALVED